MTSLIPSQESIFDKISNTFKNAEGKVFSIEFSNDELNFNIVINRLAISETDYKYNFGEHKKENYIFSILKHNIRDVFVSDDLMIISFKSESKVYFISANDF